MQNIILFILTYILVFLIYQLFFILPVKRKRKKKKDSLLVEVKYLNVKHNLDLSKVNYNQLLQIICIVSSFNITIAVTVFLLFSNFLVSLIVSFLSMIILFIFSYYLVALFYKSKGLIKK